MAAPTLIQRAADTLLDLPYEAWHFGDSVAFEGMLAASDALQDPKYFRFAHGFARGWAAARPDFRPLDCTAAGAAICLVADRTQDEILRDHLVRLGDYLTDRATLGGVYQTWTRSPLRDTYGDVPLEAWETDLLADPGRGVFIDCLHFDPPFFAALSALTGDTRWLDEAVQQARGYIGLLQDAETGLFNHFYLERTQRAHILGWGRGQGWALLGLLEVIGHLDDGVIRTELAHSARRAIDAMLRLQRPDGHWNAVVQRPIGDVETSTAAFMAVALRRAALLGVADESVVRDASDRAYSATIASMSADGILGGVSAAVWACTSLSHYDLVPRGFTVPWGQGPAVLALMSRVGASEAAQTA